jgi:hypothetical protein
LALRFGKIAMAMFLVGGAGVVVLDYFASG